MTPQELKNSILQLAIQGKLVEQRAEEGTAAELVEKILATKNAKGAKKDLTRSRGARGEKKTSALSASPREKIPDDEKPFDIPESWEWVRLGDVASIERGSGIKRSETSSSGFPCVRYGEIYTTYGYSFTSTKSFVTETVASSCHKANHGDVLCTLTGEWKEEIAKATAYLGKAPIAVGGDLAKISSHVFNPVLLVYFFFAPFMIQQKASKANGTMIVHIGKEAVSNLLIPLPPLAEQKRIVAKIEELLPLIDRYEKAWSKLEDFNKRFPVDMQKSLLQMAIQGKLVDQRPEEGTGEELLDKIFAAKNAKGAKKNLTRSRGARGEKNTSALSASPREAIPDDEKPFDIPESWVWVRVGDVCTNIQYGSSKKSAPTGTVPVLRMGNIQNGRIDYSKLVFTSDEDEIRKYSLEVDDLLFNRTNSKELVGKVALYKGERPAIYAGYLVRLTPVNISADYLNYVMQSQYYWGYCQSVRSDAIGQSNINAEKLKRFVVPLPPLAEQKRIVAKLEEILPLCERLK